MVFALDRLSAAGRITPFEKGLSAIADRLFFYKWALSKLLRIFTTVSICGANF
jgi:hypothetical protein